MFKCVFKFHLFEIIIIIKNKSIGQSREETGHEEENIFHPSHYSHLGCPTLPIAFAGAQILRLKLYFTGNDV